MISPVTSPFSSQAVQSIKPLNYSVENTAELSESYKADSTKATKGVNAVNPVQYPNAKVVDETRFNNVSKAQEVSKKYNEIANGLNKTTTGYTDKSQRTNYETLGNVIDLFA